MPSAQTTLSCEVKVLSILIETGIYLSLTAH